MMIVSRKNLFLSCRKLLYLQVLPLPGFHSSIALCFLAFALSSCQHNDPKKSETISSLLPQKDLFPHKVEIKYAKGFSVTYHDYYKIVSIIDPFSKQPDTTRYILLQRGMPQPEAGPEDQVIEIPIRKMIVSSSAHIALTGFLNSNRILVGLGSFDYITSPEVLKMIDQKKIAEVGIGQSLNQELVLSLAPDLLMMMGRSDGKYNSNPILTQAGIGVLTNAEWMENTPLGRAEWVKLMAVFLNKESLANEKFSEIETKYLKLAELAQKAHIRPTVFNGMSFKGTWHVAGGDGYMAHFFKDASVSYLWASDPSRGSLNQDFESVYAIAMNADFWINPGSAKTKADILTNDSRNADFKAFKSGRVYNNNKRINERGSNDYWESGIVNPHLVLSDLIKIFHPELIPEHQLVYYKIVAP